MVASSNTIHHPIIIIICEGENSGIKNSRTINSKIILLIETGEIVVIVVVAVLIILLQHQHQ